jgi:hypothetical protein
MSLTLTVSPPKKTQRPLQDQHSAILILHKFDRGDRVSPKLPRESRSFMALHGLNAQGGGSAPGDLLRP